MIEDITQRLQQRIDRKAKPLGSFGQLETLALQKWLYRHGTYLLAERMWPSLREHSIFTHQSNEAGHRLMLQAIGAQPHYSLTFAWAKVSHSVVPVMSKAVVIKKE